MKVIKLELTSDVLEDIIQSLESQIRWIEYQRSYNNTNDPQEKLRIIKIDKLRSIKNRLKDGIHKFQ